MTPTDDTQGSAERPNTLLLVATFEASATVTKAADVQPDTEPHEE